ncbi:MAG: hypothetical protein WC401_10645, partial [Bacteroidales bacterium]
KKKKKELYLLSPELKWKTFKKFHDVVVNDSGPTPIEGLKVLWELNKDGMIYCWFDPDKKGDMLLGFKLPKNCNIFVLTNKK